MASANTTTDTQSIDVLGLQPNQNYIIKVYAVHTASDGTVTHSDYSVPLNITTPAYAPGGNFAATNDGTDIQLNGGSLFAGTFGTSPGSINVVTDTVDGTGVILNQTGLAGYNSGVQEFYLDASTGNAYFAGTIGATIIESAGYDPANPTDGSDFATVAGTDGNIGMAINLNNGSITSSNFRIDTSGNAFFAGSVTGTATINGTAASTVVSNAASGKLKNVTFTQDTQPTALNIGDLWYDSGHGFKMYRWNGTTWSSVQDTAIGNAASAALAAQQSANGKNVIIYGAKTPPPPNNLDITYGQAPDLKYYQIANATKSTSVNKTTGAVTTTTTDAINTFPTQFNNTTNNIAGDTWFVLNINGSVIAQYTVSADASKWLWTTVSGQIIGNLDAGKITAGTLSAVSINNNSGTFAVDTYGNLTATSAYITGAIVGSTITGGTIQTALTGNRIVINDSNNTGKIGFYSTVTAGIYAAPGEILVGATDNSDSGGISTATIGISSPNFDSRYDTPALMSLTSYSDGTSGIIAQASTFQLAGSVISGSSKNTLRGITTQTSAVIAGTTATGYNEGDIMFVYTA